MKNWQLFLIAIVCGGICWMTVGGSNPLTPTICWVIGVIALCGVDYKKLWQGFN